MATNKMSDDIEKTLTGLTQSIDYLDKVFRQPNFVWNDGQCDLDLLFKDVAGYHAGRAQLLASTLQDDANTQMTQPGNDDKPQQDEPTKPTPQDVPIASKPDTDAIPASVTVKPSLITAIATRSAVVPLVSDVWNASEPINYHAQFQIGTEPKTFFLDIDSGSSLLWLQAMLSSSDPAIKDQNMYQPFASTTSTETGEAETVNYGDTTRVNTTIYQDTIRVGKLTGTNQTVGAATVANLAKVMKGSKANGIIGLGFPRIQQTNRQNLVQSLQATGQLKYASFSLIGPRVNPADAIAIDSKKIMQPRGHFVIGSVDRSFYTGEIAWCPVTADAGNRWLITLDEVRVNGIVKFTNQKALIDTGTAWILVSPKRLVQVSQTISGCISVPKQPLFIAYPQPSLQTLSFVFGGREFHLGSSDNLGHRQVEGRDLVVSSVCTLQDKWPFDEDVWLIGGIFLDNVVTIFDYEKRMVGFADISEADMDASALAEPVHEET